MAKPPTSLSQYKDNRVERILANEGYHYELQEIVLEDVVRYDDSQARIGVLDSVFVNKYKFALKNGAVFPPIVVYTNGRGGYVGLDGNHRAEASRKAGRSTIQAYVIKETLTQHEAVYVSGIINASTNGKPITDKRELDRLILAAAKSRPGVADERIGQELGLSRTRVRHTRTAHASRERLKSLGVDPSTLGVGESVIRDLHTKITDDSVMKEAAELIRDAGLKGEDISDLFRAIEKAGTEADRIVAVQKERSDRQAEIDGYGKVYIIPADIVAAVNSIRKATTTYPEPTRWNPLTPAKRAEFYGKIHDTIAFLVQVDEFLGPIVTQDAEEAALLESHPEDDDDEEVA